ncbi:phage Gp37/Gp68 family protein [Mesorhizobium sp. KR9-304]|uniref:DUF5131 family protein n=1 Tax=Mesorhizobium sp. KR9-304 TaxID=3156614 RepID=UPI0032B33390
MANGTTIEWTHRPGAGGETWNPLAGCTILTPGCTNCYAMKMAARIEAINAAAGRETHYAGTTRKVKGKAIWTGKVALAPEHILTAPLRWKSPRTVFVNSMSDLFHEDVPDEWIDRVFAVMALCPQHTFQVLTKRSARMRAYLSAARAHPVGLAALELTLASMTRDPNSKVGEGIVLQGDIAHLQVWPLSNAWLGVSAEDQRRADERIPDLLATPAAIRFVSAEPLLGPIDFGFGVHHHPDNVDSPELQTLVRTARSHLAQESGTAILDWVIVGGESGQGARPMHPAWALSIRDQCAAAGVPFFFKQWGEHLGGYGNDHGDGVWFTPSSDEREGRWLRTTDSFDWFDPLEAPDGPMHLRTGKKRAGRLLDGVEHNSFPVMSR